MASVAKEDGLLKLVHPGRNVEIYRTPITAAQVMIKYPRHSVTRPDVFEYPWIVVRPESVLNLGKVFYVVPNCTIYKLLKAHRERNQQDSLGQIQSPNKRIYQQQEQHKDSPIKINAGSTPNNLTCQPSPNRPSPSSTISCMWMNNPDQECDLRAKNQSKVGSWPDVMPKNNKNNHLRIKEKPVKESRVKVRSFDRDLESANTNMTAELRLREDVREVTKLKSCLRKPGSGRKSRKLQVSFLLPTEYVEPRRIKLSTEDLTGRSLADFFVQSASLVPTKH